MAFHIGFLPLVFPALHCHLRVVAALGWRCRRWVFWALIGISSVQTVSAQPAPPVQEDTAHEAWQVLLGQSGLPVSKFPACEPYGIDPTAPSKTWTLAQDLAKVIPDVAQQPGQMSSRAHCEPTAKPKRRFCTVHLGYQHGENVWSRIYLFEHNTKGTLLSLQCVVVP